MLFNTPKISQSLKIATVTLFASVLQIHAITDQERHYIESYGWIVGQQSGIAQMGLSDEEMDVLVSGLHQARRGSEPPHNLQLIGPDMERFLKGKAEAFKETYQKRMEAMREKTESQAQEAAGVNKKAGAAYIAKLTAENDKVKSTASGLHYEILEAGTDPKPSATDKVKVHYEGTLIDGSMFDSSIKRGEPATFPLNGVIKGWTEGMQLVGKGGKIKLYVPSDLAYGDTGRPGIPPGSTLIFEVEVIDINPSAKSATTPAIKVEEVK